MLEVVCWAIKSVCGEIEYHRQKFARRSRLVGMKAYIKALVATTIILLNEPLKVTCLCERSLGVGYQWQLGYASQSPNGLFIFCTDLSSAFLSATKTSTSLFFSYCFFFSDEKGTSFLSQRPVRNILGMHMWQAVHFLRSRWYEGVRRTLGKGEGPGRAYLQVR